MTCWGTSSFSRSTLPHGVRYETSDVREGGKFYWNFSQWRWWRFECCWLRPGLNWYIPTKEYLGYSTGCRSGNAWMLVCDNKGPQVYDVIERVAAVDYTPYIHTICCLASPERRRVHSFSTLSYDRSIASSKVSSFKWEYPLLSLRSSSSSLRLLPRLPLTSILPFIFPPITRCRRQFLRKMWPIRLASFRLLISCRIFLFSFTLSNTS